MIHNSKPLIILEKLANFRNEELDSVLDTFDSRRQGGISKAIELIFDHNMRRFEELLIDKFSLMACRHRRIPSEFKFVVTSCYMLIHAET